MKIINSYNKISSKCKTTTYKLTKYISSLYQKTQNFSFKFLNKIIDNIIKYYLFRIR